MLPKYLLQLLTPTPYSATSTYYVFPNFTLVLHPFLLLHIDMNYYNIFNVLN